MISVRSKSSYPIGNLLKGSKSKRPPGSAIPPAHGDASGRFGLVVLAHEECCSQGWLFVFSRLVALRPHLTWGPVAKGGSEPHIWYIAVWERTGGVPVLLYGGSLCLQSDFSTKEYL